MTGQQAYERDVAAHPTYHDGSPRPSWEKLKDYARRSWELEMWTKESAP